jgi:hypothetical protein
MREKPQIDGVRTLYLEEVAALSHEAKVKQYVDVTAMKLVRSRLRE